MPNVKVDTRNAAAAIGRDTLRHQGLKGPHRYLTVSFFDIFTESANPRPYPAVATSNCHVFFSQGRRRRPRATVNEDVPVKQRRIGIGVKTICLYQGYSVRVGWMASSQRTRSMVDVYVSMRQYNINGSRSVSTFVKTRFRRLSATSYGRNGCAPLLVAAAVRRCNAQSKRQRTLERTCGALAHCTLQ